MWTTLLCNVGRINSWSDLKWYMWAGWAYSTETDRLVSGVEKSRLIKRLGRWVWEMEYPSWMWPFGTSAFVYHFLLFGKEPVTWNPGSLNKWRKATSLLCGPHWKEEKISGLWGWGSREGKARMEWKTSKGKFPSTPAQCTWSTSPKAWLHHEGGGDSKQH